MTTQTIEAQLEDFGFTPSIYTAREEREAGYKHVGQHKGWDIFFAIPNGGICAAIIIKGDVAYDFMVGDSPDDWEFHFDYLDGDGVYAHTLKAINAIEPYNNNFPALPQGSCLPENSNIIMFFKETSKRF